VQEQRRAAVRAGTEHVGVPEDAVRVVGAHTGQTRLGGGVGDLGAQRVRGGDRDGVDVRAERLVERRHPHARAAGSGLVHEVQDHRPVLLLEARADARLLLGEEDPVAVVIVPDVLVVQVRVGARVAGALGLVEVVDQQVLPVRVRRRHHEDHQVVQDVLDVLRPLGRQPVDHVDQRRQVADLG
jgi:hypothetical protein